MHWYFKVVINWSLEGRSSRKEFWMFLLITQVIVFLLAYIEVFIYAKPDNTLIIARLYNAAMIIPSVLVAWRRIQDTGCSGLAGVST